MAFTFYDGIEAYAKKANCGLFIECKTAIFNNPADQILTPKGKVTKVRQYDAGKAGNYSKTKGWMTQYGNGDGVQWKEYRAPYDRAKVLQTDAIDEAQSFANGMTPSIELLNSDFLDNQLPKEIDATNISTWFNKLSGDNVFDAVEDLPIDPEHILSTITSLQMKIFNSGYDRDSVLFISGDAYENMITAIQNKMGLANNALMYRTVSVTLDTGLKDTENNGVVTVSNDVEVYGKFLIIPVPDDRMWSHIIMLSGDPDDAGQEDGGFIPDYENENLQKVKLFAIPMEAAFCNVRYMIDNFWVPGQYAAGLEKAMKGTANLRPLNERMFGNVEILNAGINQKANAFEYDIRAIYGGDLFDNRARNCFAVSEAYSEEPTSYVTFSADKQTEAVGEVITITASAVGTDTWNGSLQIAPTKGSEGSAVFTDSLGSENLGDTLTNQAVQSIGSTFYVKGVTAGEVELWAAGTGRNIKLTITSE